MRLSVDCGDLQRGSNAQLEFDRIATRGDLNRLGTREEMFPCRLVTGGDVCRDPPAAWQCWTELELAIRSDLTAEEYAIATCAHTGVTAVGLPGRQNETAGDIDAAHELEGLMNRIPFESDRNVLRRPAFVLWDFRPAIRGREPQFPVTCRHVLEAKHPVGPRRRRERRLLVPPEKSLPASPAYSRERAKHRFPRLALHRRRPQHPSPPNRAGPRGRRHSSVLRAECAAAIR